MIRLTCYPLKSSVTITLSILRPSRRHFSLLTTNTSRTTSRTIGISRLKATIKTFEDLDTMREAMRENKKAPQTRMAKYYNQKVANKAPQFKVGDWVMVNAKNIKTKRPSKNLDYKLRGKFEIEKLCGTYAYRLKLPPLSGKIHQVFHVSLLEPYHQNTMPGRRSPTPPQVDLEQQGYLIEKIKTMEIKGGQVKYLVSWRGYGPDGDTWEPYENLKDSGKHVVRQFHLDNPRKPRDPEVLV